MKKLEKSEKDLLIEINNKLQDLISLYVIQGKDVDDQIQILTKRGYKPTDISTILGLTPNAVRLRKFKTNKGA